MVKKKKKEKISIITNILASYTLTLCTHNS